MRKITTFIVSLLIFSGSFMANAAEVPLAKDHEFNNTTPTKLKGKTVTLQTADGDEFQTYISGSINAKAGVLVIHEWWGLNDHIKNATDRLADEGYLALAVDLYNGKTTTNPDEATKLMQAVNQAKANAILQAGITHLRTSSRKVGTIGWCFGGGQSLRATLQDPDSVAATVIYYGEPVTDIEKLKTLNAPVLGIFAKQDAWITPDKVTAFEQAMKKAGETLTVYNYDANHAFANPSGPNYNSAAAKDAWAKTQEFLAKNLK